VTSLLDELDLMETSPDRALLSVDSREVPWAVMTPRLGLIPKNEFSDLYTAYEKVKRVEGVIKELGGRISYEDEESAMKKLKSSEVPAVLVPPLAKKEEIISLAIEGKVLAPKSTRHVIPARPLFVRVPLDLLKSEEVSDEVANEIFISSLMRRGVRHLGPGATLDRRYEEDLYIFDY